ncbi:signal peptide-containing [Pyrenophora seminiperda CCB06]|uniref:Signal peptide-containing n=1 Tax=Pyrenophora seminiperda CCB06 TaxID=1302712 RepID=A0A3M7MDN7_9PLEO|nr:signal peptide-containing [Pyrenophora seminiperda CCB06]
MAWFMRGVQSAVFHYASCAPCTGYSDGRKRRKAAKTARKLREKLEIEQPDEYHHPEPTGTNVYWNEEITLGPGPPPRKARRTTTANTDSSRGLKTRGTQSPPMDKGGSSSDVDRGRDLRLSDETLGDDDTWNHKRYQREDEDLWGHDDPPIHLQPTVTGSSVGGAGYQMPRPGTSRSGSYYTARAPPVNELHPPVVSLPSPDPSDNRWMLQPPPKASVMAGKERASNRSRSGSGASSRVELSLGRQVSTRQLMYKLERGQTPDASSASPNGSYFNLTPAHSQRRDRCRTPQARPPSATSSSYRKRRDTTMSHNHAMMRTESASTHDSSEGASDTIVRGLTPTPGTAAIPDIKVVRARQNRPALSTVLSSNSGTNRSDENVLHLPEKPRPTHQRYPTVSTLPKSSDLASLSCLEDLVSPHALLQSRFVSAPLVEAKIRLPPSEEDVTTQSREWEEEDDDAEAIVRVPFDRDFGPSEKDPRFRWSVDF